MKVFRNNIIGIQCLILFLWPAGNLVALGNIDTRFESAIVGQQNLSFVYKNQQSVNAPAFFFGDVEFSSGLACSGLSGGPFPPIALGITPPLGGSLRIQGPPSVFLTSAFTVSHDLILSTTLLEGAATFFNTFDFTISPNPSTIFLTRDLSLNTGIGITLRSDSAGTLNGNFNTLELTSATQSALILAGSGGAGHGIILKDINLVGLTVNNFSINGPTTFQNVQISTFIGQQTAVIPSRLTYQGQNNMIGDGGGVHFVSTGLGFLIARQSHVHVTPNTTLGLLKFPSTPWFFVFGDKSSELILDNCTLNVGSALSPFPSTVFNMTFTAGTMIINGNVLLTTDHPGSSLQLGDGVDPANNFNVLILPGSKLIIDNKMTLSNANV